VASSERVVFVAGGTGYMGRPLIVELMRLGHSVKALARRGSEAKLPPKCEVVSGNPLDRDSYVLQIQPANTFVHLVGVSHPNPSKASEFRSVDLVAAKAAVQAARQAGIDHFVYVSVAHPAPVMKEYIAVRMECEESVVQSGINATILRPWYVLGPGHRWPYALLPLYWLAERLPSTRDGARRLGLVTRGQMVRILVHAVENPCKGVRVLGVPEIRASGLFNHA
jgi:uncharacterized protein YbjT (DUF2867 family)